MKKSNSPVEILRDIKKNISLHQSFGINHYPKSDLVTDFFEKTKRFASVKPDIFHSPGRLARGVETKTKEALQVKQTLDDIRRELGDCTRCSLHENRTRILFGSGNADADLLIVGEAPAPYEDAEGVPFGEEEGELLIKMLGAIDIDISDVYCTNIVKCRLPTDSKLLDVHVNTCRPFLASQVEVIAPKVICTMGTLAGQSMLKSKVQLINLRGRFHDFNGVALMPTFHPAYLLKNPEMKKATWVDLQLIQQKLKNK